MIRNGSWTLAFVLAAALLWVSAGAATRSRLAVAAADRALVADHFSGSAVIGTTNGTIALAKGYGQRNVPSTVFDIGSVAKLFTAAAVLRLEQAGKLRLDRSIVAYLPGVPPADRSITVRELLLHTSGLPANFSSDLEVLDRTAATRRILALPRSRIGRFIYSNAGYVLLGSIVEQVSGLPFRTYMRRFILRPAGVKRIGWYGDPTVTKARATGFVNSRARGVAGNRPLSWSILGAGGMLASAPDLFHWYAALARGRVLDGSHVADLERGYLKLRPGLQASFGGVVATTANGKVVAIGGGTDFGFSADVRRFLGPGVISVLLANTTAAPAAPAGFAIARALGY